MTQTEKQYSKNVGKLFVCKDRYYNHDKRGYSYTYYLCFIYGMVRSGYKGNTGAYAYKIQTLFPKVENEWRMDYTMKCKDFIDGPARRRYWNNAEYMPNTPENLQLIGKVIDIEEKS